MEKRHMDIIQQRADEFAQTGVTSFKRWELKSWFGAERLAKNVWRTILEYIWEKKEGAKVTVYESDGGFVLVDTAKLHKIEQMV